MSDLNELKKELKRYFCDEKTYHLKLAHLFDKEIYLVTTKFQENRIKIYKEKVKVYNPLNSNSRPASNCDICIGGSSVDSKDIYGLYTKDITNKSGVYTLRYHMRFTLFNYCEKDDFEELKEKHMLIASDLIYKTKQLLSKQLKELKSVPITNVNSQD